jgi:hypothetical protein
VNPVQRDEILNLYEYEKVREARRQELIDLKRRRRVQVGRYLSFVFENRETVWFQIQEMIRAERIVDDAKVSDELDVYNGLLPKPGELAATMFIEIGDPAAIRPVLDALLGIDTRDYVRMEIDGRVIVGRFEAGHSDEELGKLSAVHFVRFEVPPDVRKAFAGADVTLVVDHPNERARAALSTETKASLAEDLA